MHSPVLKLLRFFSATQTFIKQRRGKKKIKYLSFIAVNKTSQA